MNEPFEELVPIASGCENRVVMQHMMRTTGTLSELAPSFEKPRGDARTGQHDKASGGERTAAKNAFGNLVKKSDDQPANADKSGRSPENVRSLPDSQAASASMKGREPGMLQLGIEDAKSIPGQPKTGLSEALKFTLSAAEGNRHGRDGGTAQSDGQISDPEAVSHHDRTKSGLATAKDSTGLRSVGSHEIGLQSAPHEIDGGQSKGNEAQLGREPVAGEMEIPVGEPKLPDRKLDGGAATQLAAASLEASEEMSPQGEARPASRRPVEAGPLALDMDDQIDGKNVSERNNGPGPDSSSVIGIPSQPSQALNQSSALLQAAAGQAVPTGWAGATSAWSSRVERNVRPVTEAMASGRFAPELSASSAMPELRARLATETATAQRVLNLDEQAFEMGNDFEANALNGPVRVMKQESHPAVAPDVRIGPASVFGQLVQSIASTDGLPKLGSELRLLATTGNTSLTPEPLKVLHIQLQPRELGDLAVRIALRGDKIELRVQTQRQATANLLMSDQRLLVEALQQRNLDVDTVTIQVVEPDKASSNLSAALPNSGQGKSGQSDAFLSGSQGQASRQNGENDSKSEVSANERHSQQQDTTALDEFGRRRGVYL